MEYTNPVGNGITMGDPFVLRHEGRYYLYGTTASDGFKAWRSTDLVDWQPLGYVFQRSDSTWGAKSFWAPEVSCYRGSFYLVYSVAPPTGSFRVCIARSDSPEGPFEDMCAPLFDPHHGCIDAHLFIDDDTTPYLFYDEVGAVGTPSREGKPTGYMYGIVRGARLSPDLKSLAGDSVICSQAQQSWEKHDSTFSRCNEGAFVFKLNGTYYMTYSVSHYGDPDYAIGYSTAPSPLGPWTKAANNPLLAKDLAAGVSGPGHSCVTRSPDGSELFIVYHAHADIEKPGGHRVVCIDRLLAEPDGSLRVAGPTRTPQSMPR